MTSRFGKVQCAGNNFTFKEKPVRRVGMEKFKSFIVENIQNLAVFNRIPTFCCIKSQSEQNVRVFNQGSISLVASKTLTNFRNRKTKF